MTIRQLINELEDWEEKLTDGEGDTQVYLDKFKDAKEQGNFYYAGLSKDIEFTYDGTLGLIINAFGKE